MKEIIQRIERESGVADLATILAERIGASDLQSLLLEVYRRRARKREPADVLRDYRENRFVSPSPVAPARLNEWERVLLEELPDDFEALTLAPVCPLGTAAGVSNVDPIWSLATVRNTEVVSDLTNVLTLECAERRKALRRADLRSVEAVQLASHQRVLRPQHFEPRPGYMTHFALFGLCSAGRNHGSVNFERVALGQHVRFHLRALRAFLGAEISLRLMLTDFRAGPLDLDAEFLEPLRRKFEGVECALDPQRTSGRGYYPGLCFQIEARRASGENFLLVDGGAVDWTGRLMSDSRERLVISGVGSERVCTLFEPI